MKDSVTTVCFWLGVKVSSQLEIDGGVRIKLLKTFLILININASAFWFTNTKLLYIQFCSSNKSDISLTSTLHGLGGGGGSDRRWTPASIRYYLYSI